MSQGKNEIEPEEECDQEVRARAWSQQEDVQMEVHIQFDLKPGHFRSVSYFQNVQTRIGFLCRFTDENKAKTTSA